MICNFCHSEIPDGAAFCPNCGKRLEEAEPCRKCGTVYSGNFCPNCGAPRAEAQAVGGQAAAKSRWKHPAALTAGILALVAAVVSLALVCLIDFRTLATEGAQELGTALETHNVFYYFYQSYADAADLIEQQSSFHYGSLEIADYLAVYLPVVSGSLISAATIVSTAVFGIKTLCAFFAQLEKKIEMHVERLACGTYLSYAAGVVGLSALQFASMKLRDPSLGQMSATLFPNWVTLLGVLLGGACLVAALVLCAVLRAPELSQKRPLGGILCASVGIALLSAVFGIAATTGISLRYASGEYYEAVCYGLMTLVRTDDLAALLLAFGGYVSLAIVVVLAGKELYDCAAAFSGTRAPRVGRAAAAMIFAVLLLVCTILAGNRLFPNSGYTVGYGTAIGILVLAVLNLARSITQKVLQGD